MDENQQIEKKASEFSELLLKDGFFTIQKKTVSQLLIDFSEDSQTSIQKMNYSSFKKFVLDTDLKEMSTVHLPENARKVNDFPKEAYVLQINGITNLTKKNDENRLLQFTLTDGLREINAIEFRPIPKLSLKTDPGTKIRIKETRIEKGILLLEEKTIDILGGAVEDLIESWRIQQMLKVGRKPVLPFSEGGPPPFTKLISKNAPQQKLNQNPNPEGSGQNQSQNNKNQQKNQNSQQGTKKQPKNQPRNNNQHNQSNNNQHNQSSNNQRNQQNQSRNNQRNQSSNQQNNQPRNNNQQNQSINNQPNQSRNNNQQNNQPRNNNQQNQANNNQQNQSINNQPNQSRNNNQQNNQPRNNNQQNQSKNNQQNNQPRNNNQQSNQHRTNNQHNQSNNNQQNQSNNNQQNQAKNNQQNNQPRNNNQQKLDPQAKSYQPKNLTSTGSPQDNPAKTDSQTQKPPQQHKQKPPQQHKQKSYQPKNQKNSEPKEQQNTNQQWAARRIFD